MPHSTSRFKDGRLAWYVVLYSSKFVEEWYTLFMLILQFPSVYGSRILFSMVTFQSSVPIAYYVLLISSHITSIVCTHIMCYPIIQKRYSRYAANVQNPVLVRGHMDFSRFFTLRTTVLRDHIMKLCKEIS